MSLCLEVFIVSKYFCKSIHKKPFQSSKLWRFWQTDKRTRTENYMPKTKFPQPLVKWFTYFNSYDKLHTNVRKIQVRQKRPHTWPNQCWMRVDWSCSVSLFGCLSCRYYFLEAESIRPQSSSNNLLSESSQWQAGHSRLKVSDRQVLKTSVWIYMKGC